MLIKDHMNYAAAAQLETGDYRMIARSVKFCLPLVLLTFATIFMLELFKELRIHTMQYILVGAGLSVFYLIIAFIF